MRSSASCSCSSTSRSSARRGQHPPHRPHLVRRAGRRRRGRGSGRPARSRRPSPRRRGGRRRHRSAGSALGSTPDISSLSLAALPRSRSAARRPPGSALRAVASAPRSTSFSAWSSSLVVEGDDRLAQRRRVAGVEGGVPLPVLVAEADHDHVGVADQGLGADRVDPGALVVAPEGIRLLAERPGAGVVGGGMVGDRCAQLDRQAGLLDAVGDLLAPVGVDLAGEVDVPGSARSRRQPNDPQIEGGPVDGAVGQAARSEDASGRARARAGSRSSRRRIAAPAALEVTVAGADRVRQSCPENMQRSRCENGAVTGESLSLFDNRRHSL